jgi:hypothetical protein
MKPFLFITAVWLGFFVYPFGVDAALVNIDKEGGFVVNVLSIVQVDESDLSTTEGLEVKRLVNRESRTNSRIALTNDNGNIELTVEDESGKKVLDVTSYPDDVLEIEERPKVQRMLIRVDGAKFILDHEGVVVATEYNLNIDPKTATLSVNTPTGHKFLVVLPKSAIDGVIRAKILSEVDEVNLREADSGILSYDIRGHKTVNILNLLDYKTQVGALVSVSTGEIISIDQPKWLQMLGFLFV